MGESSMFSGLKVSRALLEEIERQNKMDEYRTQRGLLPLTAKAAEPNFFELREYIQSRPWERQKNVQLAQRQPEGTPQPPAKRGRGRPRKDEKLAENANNKSPAAEPLQKKAK